VPRIVGRSGNSGSGAGSGAGAEWKDVCKVYGLPDDEVT
jgi:hypothetical protein